MFFFFFFFFKQKTAYEIRPCDWSSDVCSSDLCPRPWPRSSPATATERSRAEAPYSSRAARSEERRVGKECTVLCRSRWSPPPSKKQKKHKALHPHTPTPHNNTHHTNTQ